MTLLILGLAIFLGIHSVSIFAPAWRDRTAARLGNAWRGVYSLISLAGFALLIWGDNQARHSPVPIYAPATSLRHITQLLMLPVCGPCSIAFCLDGECSAPSTLHRPRSTTTGSP